MGRTLKVALAGNPNSGKTTLFNNLTGARQHVGNYPGVTVEKKEGFLRHGESEFHIIDLPGTYSLSACSEEERIARHFILNEQPDVIINVLDATNLERNLYLAVQFLELGIPLVLALNMSDVARAKGIEFDLEQLSMLLGAPIIPTVGNKGKGTRELLAAIERVTAPDTPIQPLTINYGPELSEELTRIRSSLESRNPTSDQNHTHWQAIKLLEGDEEILNRVSSPDLVSLLDQSIDRLSTFYGDQPDILIAERRYGFISGACQKTVRSTVEEQNSFSDRIDAVVTNRILSFPIFLGLMYLVFHLTFTIGDPMMGWIEDIFLYVGSSIELLWPKGSDSILRSLLVDGIIGGVGGVIVFLPNILLLFLAIAILEDSGYMARAAFIMDRLMNKIGLHGKSFIPMLIGFGCSVPAIMATRTLENRRDRLTTMLVIPLMSCGARLMIYALIIPAFFPRAWQAPVLWIIYIIGIVLAIVMARVLRSTLFVGESTPFVMELPPYRLPTIKGTLLNMWDRGWLYLRKAGTVILAISIVLWAMTSFPKKSEYDQNYAALSAQSEAVYLSAIADLQEDVGISSDSNLLVEAIEAEQAMKAEQRKYHPGEKEYAKAEKTKDAKIAQLNTYEEGGLLQAFLFMRTSVESVIDRFDQALAESEFEEGSPELRAVMQERQNSLAEFEAIDPEIYEAVLRYHEKIKVPFDQAISKHHQAQRMEDVSFSLAGRVGKSLEPVLRPLGFDWRIGTALIGAFAAKEVFVAQMGIVFSVGDEEPEALRDRLKRSYSPLVAFCIMLFCLISAPCMATFAITRRESNSWRWPLLQFGGLTAIAYVFTMFVYQAGCLMGWGI